MSFNKTLVFASGFLVALGFASVTGLYTGALVSLHAYMCFWVGISSCIGTPSVTSGAVVKDTVTISDPYGIINNDGVSGTVNFTLYQGTCVSTASKWVYSNNVKYVIDYKDTITGTRVWTALETINKTSGSGTTNGYAYPGVVVSQGWIAPIVSSNTSYVWVVSYHGNYNDYYGYYYSACEPLTVMPPPKYGTPGFSLGLIGVFALAVPAMLV